MTDWLPAILSWLAGMALGVFFYLGLWLTIRKGLNARHPGIWFAFSLILRTAVVIAGLYFVSGQQWPRLLFGLSGFIIARIVLTRRVKTSLTQVEAGREKGKGDDARESDT